MNPVDAFDRLRRLSGLIPRNFEELTSLCRDVIDCWIRAGLEYPSAYLEEFVSIDSQADSVRASSSDTDKADFFETFRDVYIQESKNLNEFLASKI